jgi:hypothetical protein
MPTPRALRRFVVDRLGLQRYLAKPGDGRQQPVISVANDGAQCSVPVEIAQTQNLLF